MFCSILYYLILSMALAWTPFSLQRGESRSSSSAGATDIKTPLSVGEKLSYDVSWSNFLVAGELSVETNARSEVDGKSTYHVRTEARSVGVVSAFFLRLNDEFEAYLHPDTLIPLKSERRTRHGKRRGESSVTIDQKSRVATLADGQSIAIPENTHDMASLLFALRAIDQTKGSRHNFTLLEDGKIYELIAESEGKERIRVPAGNYDATRFALRIVEGESERDSYTIRVFVAEDETRIPILLTAAASWGQVRVELISATGLRNSKR